MIWTFNIFDSIGRYCPLVYTIENAALKFFTCARICFWVSFIIIASDSPKISPEWLFQSDWFKFINMALYAFSNGYMSTCIMSLGLSKAPKETKDKAGYFMAAALLFGIFCGQALSYTFTNVGRTPTSL